MLFEKMLRHGLAGRVDGLDVSQEGRGLLFFVELRSLAPLAVVRVHPPLQMELQLRSAAPLLHRLEVAAARA